jgi:hypothetical protein
MKRLAFVSMQCLAVWAAIALFAGQSRAQQDAATVPDERDALTIPSPGDVENAARAHSTQGEVLGFDVSRGVLLLKTDRGEVRFRGKPNAVEHAKVGHRFIADYAIYGDQPWLVEQRNPGVDLEGFGQPHQMRGFVQSFDMVNGTLTVDDPSGQRKFSLHPAETEELVTGMEVDVLYVSVHGVDWVTSIQRHG